MSAVQPAQPADVRARWGWVWARAQIAGVAVSTLMWLTLLAHARAAVAVLLLAGAVLVAGWTFRPALRLRFGAHQPTSRERREVLRALVAVQCFRGRGEPAVFVTTRQGVVVTSPDRKALVVSRHLISQLRDGEVRDLEFCKMALSARAEAPVNCSRLVASIRLYELPWLILAKLAEAVARVVGHLPFMELAWRVRGVVLAIATVQAFQRGQWITMAVVIVIAVGSVTTPRWRRAWRRRLVCLRAWEVASVRSSGSNRSRVRASSGVSDNGYDPGRGLHRGPRVRGL